MLSAVLLLLAPIAGFLLFLAAVQAATGIKPKKADVIVALSGEPRRIQKAAELLKQGFARQLVIVGQDNAHEIDFLRAASPHLYQCCVTVDQSSANTSQDAQLVAIILQESKIKSVMLVTSSFHLPRARNEFKRALPEVDIVGYGVPDDFYQVSHVFSDLNVAAAFVSQYLKYLGSWMPESDVRKNVPGAERALRLLADGKNLGVLAVLVITLLFLMFASSKHRRRKLEHSTRGKFGSENSIQK